MTELSGKSYAYLAGFSANFVSRHPKHARLVAFAHWGEVLPKGSSQWTRIPAQLLRSRRAAVTL